MFMFKHLGAMLRVKEISKNYALMKIPYQLYYMVYYSLNEKALNEEYDHFLAFPFPNQFR
jgi:hypothetical protein